MSSPLTQALQEIDHWIQTSSSCHASRIRDFEIRPGLEREMIELYAEEYDFHFSEEVYELYQWHDGWFPIGDYANPIFFESLDRAVKNIVFSDFPYLPYMPLFFGDKAYWITPEAAVGQTTSPIFFFDGFISSRELRPRGVLYSDTYAPSITCLMQAIAECARTYDGISINYMKSSWEWKDLFPDFPNSRGGSILSPIYEKYGVVGSYSGLWY